METFMKVAKALSDENRVRIVMILDKHKELCVCTLIDMLDLAPSTVSKHISILKNAGLLTSRKEGRWVHYRLSTDDESPQINNTLNWLRSTIRDTTQLKTDEQFVKKCS